MHLQGFKMNIVQNSGAWLEFYDITDEEIFFLTKKLTYQDLSAQYEYHQAKNNRFKWQSDPYGWQDHVNRLKRNITQT